MFKKIKANKKIFAYGIVVLVIIISVVVVLKDKIFIDQKEQSQPKQEIKIAQLPLDLISLPEFIAQRKGFFDKYNLTVLVEQMNPSVSIKALLAKELDYIPFSSAGTIASQKGAPVKTIMILKENPTECIVVRPGLETKDVKTIAIGTKFSQLYYLTLKYIEENGLSAKIIASGQGPVTSQAMLTMGGADAAIIPIPIAFQLEKEGFTLIKLFDKEMPNGIVTTDEKIKNSPEEIKKVIGSLQLAIEFIKNNPLETKELIFDFYSLEKNETNKKIVEQTYDIAKQTFLEKGLPNEKGINNLVQIAKTGEFESVEAVDKQIVTPADIEKSFDFSFLK